VFFGVVQARRDLNVNNMDAATCRQIMYSLLFDQHSQSEVCGVVLAEIAPVRHADAPLC
jgi:hypothetical protein